MRRTPFASLTSAPPTIYFVPLSRNSYLAGPSPCPCVRGWTRLRNPYYPPLRNRHDVKAQRLFEVCPFGRSFNDSIDDLRRPTIVRFCKVLEFSNIRKLGIISTLSKEGYRRHMISAMWWILIVYKNRASTVTANFLISSSFPHSCSAKFSSIERISSRVIISFPFLCKSSEHRCPLLYAFHRIFTLQRGLIPPRY